MRCFREQKTSHRHGKVSCRYLFLADDGRRPGRRGRRAGGGGRGCARARRVVPLRPVQAHLAARIAVAGARRVQVPTTPADAARGVDHRPPRPRPSGHRRVRWHVRRRVRGRGQAKSVAATLSSIKLIYGTKFSAWKENMLKVLRVMDLDYALRVENPVAPDLDDEKYNNKLKEYIAKSNKWERSNRMAYMIISDSISDEVRGGFPDKLSYRKLDAKEFLNSIEENFKSSSKVYANTLMNKMLNTRFNGQGRVREHIMNMCCMAAELETLEVPISDGLLVDSILSSLPAQLAPMKINYNIQRENWSIADLISYIADEEEES